ncbi:unnamed protein product, partial [Ectocarpus sp. 12 AP-2014]
THVSASPCAASYACASPFEGGCWKRASSPRVGNGNSSSRAVDAHVPRHRRGHLYISVIPPARHCNGGVTADLLCSQGEERLRTTLVEGNVVTPKSETLYFKTQTKVPK